MPPEGGMHEVPGLVAFERCSGEDGLTGQTPEEAYLYNLDLSQRRAKNALQVCLGGLEDPALLDWARAHLSSTGYSSAKLVMDDKGLEDRDASRRVMFSMEMNREKLIDEIRDDLRSIPVDPPATDTPMNREAAAKADGWGKARVIDGDTLSIGDVRWRLFGIDAPEMKQGCKMEGGPAYPCGQAARDALLELIGDLDMACEQTDTDRYGRSVGICQAGGKDLGEELVSMGWPSPTCSIPTPTRRKAKLRGRPGLVFGRGTSRCRTSSGRRTEQKNVSVRRPSLSA